MTQSGGGKWSDLGQRLVSGGLAAGIGLWVMWIGGFPFHILISVVCAIMVWELLRMIGAAKDSIAISLAAGLFLLVVMELSLGLALPLLLVPALLGFLRLEQHRQTFAIYCIAILVAGYGLTALRDDFGFAWMAWLALVVIASDILGYFAGKFIGGPKFWPRISPKKTWSGTVAGWIGAAAIGAIFISQGMSGLELVWISIMVSMASQLGDISESALKRRMGVKDSSNIMPGHGGMFDRFDGMLGASIFLMAVTAIIAFPPVAASV